MNPVVDAAAGARTGGDTEVDPGLLAAVERGVRAQAAGQTEHALIARLRDAGVLPFAGADLREPLGLFRTHFLLFHCLYRLRDRLAAEGEWLRIHCLDIGIQARATDGAGAAATAGTVSAALVREDPLRAYYLDLSTLDHMDAAAVQALLDGFWRRMDGGDRRAAALAVLELADPVDDAEIQSRYRRLAQRHHPDRGGDTATLQRLNEARWILLGD
ncbi:DNA-J related domain-containing protein [Thioalkalivibrio sp. ALE19]|uniref:DNA-J related domain-containing protein n=1 Tax=Thioalkalivibrio sp. ALE19 TaxID=1266909 RepID=UPI0004122F84|nr:DNA-J related domain-containing protein [Thioalkalivibrio sp. ALE19]